MCVFVCASATKRKFARDVPLTVVCASLSLSLSADTTHGNQRKTSLTRVSSSRFNTGEREMWTSDEAAQPPQFSHGHIWAWEEGRSSNSITDPPRPPSPPPVSWGGKGLWMW